jgi:tRNA nucleotidyltransferase (CCA-adding enzyme)
VDPQQLIARVRALPAARPLFERGLDRPGVYLVGGAVRDLLRGGQPQDLDLVVEGDAAALARELGPARVHDRFGTSTVHLGGFTYDLARARRETYAQPGALPDVTPAELREDLLRRDFTVNAIALALGGQRPGELHAAPRALEDLAEERLRVLHARSFLDDPTRLLRLARYAGRLAFAVEPGTRSLAETAVAGGALARISGSRVGAELRLLARERDPLPGWAELQRLGVNGAIHPRMRAPERALVEPALALLAGEGRADLLVLGLAAREIPPADLAELLDRLAFEAGERSRVLAVAGAGGLARALHETASPAEIALALEGAAPEAAAAAGACSPETEAQVRLWLGSLRHVRLEIDGRDLLAAGVPEGPAVGRGLRGALRAKLDGRLGGREAELREALRCAQTSG